MLRKFGLATGLIVVLIILLAVNLITAVALRNAKVDLTEEKLFTLSDGSKQLLANLDDDVRVKFFYSKRAGSSIPIIKQYADRVLELLKQYEASSGGKLTLEVLEPRPDTETEEWAVKYGLRPAPIQGREDLYFGIAFVSEVGEEESISFLDPNREGYLEYDISRAIYSVSHTEKPVVGVMSSLAVMGGMGSDPMARFTQQQPAEPWFLTQELTKMFELREVPITSESIEEDIDLLLVIHPKQVAPTAEYAIDQFLLRGGRVIIMVDALSIQDQISFQSPDPNARFQATFDSNLPKLLDAWGFEYNTAKVIGDLEYATPVGGGQKHPGVLSLTQSSANQEEIISSNLENVVMVMPGALKPKKEAPYKITPIFKTSTKAAEMDGFMLKFNADPAQLMRDFNPTGEEMLLAAKVTGKFATAFPAGKPAPTTPPRAPEDPNPPEPEKHLAEAEHENTILVIADVDMIADQFSVQKQRIFNQVLAMMINDNLSFIVNAVENMTGSQELISLRTRGKSRRPFDLVDKIEREAEERYKSEEIALQKKLDDTNQKIRELESGKDATGKAVLSPTQLQEIEKFRSEVASTKSRLREVRKNLREDIENLGNTLLMINIVLIPLLVIIAGFLPGAWRSYKMRSQHG